MNDKKIYGLRGVQFGSSCSPIGIGHGDPTLIFSGNYEAEGAQALADFLNPFGDPYADAGGYNASDPTFNGTRILGAGGAIAGVAAAGVAAVGAVGVGGVASGATAAGAAAEQNPEFQEAIASNAETVGTSESDWIFGRFKSESKWAAQLLKREWTSEQITEAINEGESFPAENLVNKGNAATRYVHPTTGKSVVIDNVTKEILHIGGTGFKY